MLLDLDHPNVVGLKEYFVWHNKVGFWRLFSAPFRAARRAQPLAARRRRRAHPRSLPCSRFPSHLPLAPPSRPQVYLIMELLRGGDLLETIMAIGRYSEADARAVFVQLIAAVRYLHSQ